MKKIIKDLPSLRKSVRIIGDLVSDNNSDLPSIIMNDLLDYKDALEDFEYVLSDLKEDLAGSEAYNNEYIDKTIQAIRDDNKPVLEVIINSGGGNVTDGFAIIDVIKELQEIYDVQVNTHVIGECASMAVAVFMVGDVRTAGENSIFMLHQLKGGAIGSQNKIESTIQCMNIMNRKYKELFKDTRISQEELDEILSHDKDHYFDIDQAREWGIVNDDDIIDMLMQALGEDEAPETPEGIIEKKDIVEEKKDVEVEVKES